MTLFILVRDLAYLNGQIQLVLRVVSTAGHGHDVTVTYDPTKTDAQIKTAVRDAVLQALGITLAQVTKVQFPLVFS